MEKADGGQLSRKRNTYTFQLKTRCSAILVVCILLISINLVAETKKVTRMDLYPFIPTNKNIPSLDLIRILIKEYSGDIKNGFGQVGLGDLFPSFLETLRSANFTNSSLPVGGTISWMLFRVDRVIEVWLDVEWAGEKPLEVLSLTVKKNDRNFQFIVADPSGNIGLLNITGDIGVSDVPIPIGESSKSYSCETKTLILKNGEGFVLYVGEAVRIDQSDKYELSFIKNKLTCKDKNGTIATVGDQGKMPLCEINYPPNGYKDSAEINNNHVYIYLNKTGNVSAEIRIISFIDSEEVKISYHIRKA